MMNRTAIKRSAATVLTRLVAVTLALVLLVAPVASSIALAAETTSTPEAPPATPIRKPRPDVTVAFVGDITFSRSGGAKFGNPDKLLAAVKPQLLKADLTFGNLETPLSSRGKPAGKTYTFRGPTTAAAALKRAGFDAVSVANNHALDYGRIAFADTLKALNKAEVKPVGGGKDKKAAWAPVIIDKNGAKIALLAFSEISPASFAATSSKSGCAHTQKFSAIKKAVKASAKKADYTIVYMHWGIELDYTPSKRQIREARELIKAGASAVLTSHPHVLQPVEFHKGGLIAYSLGNFIFSPGSDKGHDSAILTLTLSDKGVKDVVAYPVYLSGYTPKPAKGKTAKRILSILKKSSTKRGTKVTVKGNKATFTP